MSWKVRHQGSPRPVENLTLQNIIDGLQDDQWETTDEVMGPKDQRWVAIESHPQFAEVVDDLDTDHVAPEVDEAHLDMNALIDVVMVLLIFFILTMSYIALEKYLDTPRTKSDTGQIIRPDPTALSRMIKVEVRQDKGKTKVFVEQRETSMDNLVRTLKNERKNEVLLYAEPKVDWGTVIGVVSAAGEARIERVHFEHRSRGKPAGS